MSEIQISLCTEDMVRPTVVFSLVQTIHSRPVSRVETFLRRLYLRIEPAEWGLTARFTLDPWGKYPAKLDPDYLFLFRAGLDQFETYCKEQGIIE